MQALMFGTRTCSIMAIRVLDLPPHMSHSKAAYRVVAVIEGKSEKKELKAITTKIVEDFKQYYPGWIPQLVVLQLPTAPTLTWNN
jgi:hypothetical protein